MSRADRREALLARAEAQSAGAVVLRRFADVAWYTGGLDIRIDRSGEAGSTVLLVTADHEWLVTDVIEGPRLRDEEPLAGDYTIVEHRWTAEAGNELLSELADGATVAEAADLGIDELRPVLDADAIDRYRALGRDTRAAFDETIAALTPTTTEREAAAQLAAAAWRRHGHVPVLLVAGADRLPRYRHPLATDALLGGRAMLVACVERGGLYASLTRIVDFDEPSPDTVRRQAATDELLARVRDEATQPGRTLGEVFGDLRRFYADAGFPDEWERHHQGGIAGYKSREVIATPDDPTVIRSGMAFAWNPSVAGAKSEETFVLHEGGVPEVLT